MGSCSKTAQVWVCKKWSFESSWAQNDKYSLDSTQNSELECIFKPFGLSHVNKSVWALGLKPPPGWGGIAELVDNYMAWNTTCRASAGRPCCRRVHRAKSDWEQRDRRSLP